MESLIIGGLQGLMNYAGISFLDKLKIKKKLKRIEEGTASILDCADVILQLQKEKDAYHKIITCCEHLIRYNKQLTFAYTHIGTSHLHLGFRNGSISADQLLTADWFTKSKACFEKAREAKADKTRTDCRHLNLEDLQVLSQIYGMLNYYYGFIMHIEGNETQAQHLKELGINQNHNMKGVLPY